MITSELVEYIKKQLNKNISKDLIFSQLSKVGWRNEDIEEAFLNIESTQVSNKEIIIENNNFDKNLVDNSQKKEIEANDNFDPYRELPEISNPSTEKIDEYNTPVINIIDKVEPMKIWAPISIKPKELEIVNKEVKNIKTTELEIFNPELKKGDINSDTEIKKQEDIEFFSQSGVNIDYNNELKPEKNSFISPSIDVPKIDFKKIEKTIENDNLVPLINKNPSFVANGVSLPPRKNIQDIKPSSPVNTMLDIVPKSAMISSYSQDILSAKKEEIPVVKKKNLLIKWGIAIFVTSLIGGMVFAFVEGSLKIPWMNVNYSVVKKDPKVTMLNAPLTLSKLNSYKVSTEISISSPSLSSITTGLSSGDAIVSKEKDSISINTKGIVNHVDGKLSFDYLANINSSILKNDIDTNIKYINSDLYIQIPDLKQILGKNTPPSGFVSLKTKQLGLITEEFSNPIQDIIKKIDMYNILSGEVPIYVRNELTSIFKEFINTLEYTEKGVENINGIDMYHYYLTANRQSTKKLLVSSVKLLTSDISDEQKKNLDEAFGASSITSFEVWTGKNDDNLYQIKFKLKAPLSRVLRINDSGIAGNEVELDWSTKFYDLNIPNNISKPESSISIEDFINKIKDIKIKNIISSFKIQTTAFKNAVGSYGLRSNPTGSCLNPNPKSLFSPTGHTKGADGAISLISDSMNSLLTVTNGLGSCYSTSAAWALSVPLFSNTDPLSPSYYCSDSTGNITTVPSSILGTICK